MPAVTSKSSYLHIFNITNGGQLPVQFTAIRTDQYVLWSIKNMQSIYQQGVQMAQSQFQEAIAAYNRERALLLQKIEESEAKRKEMQAHGDASTTGIKFMQYEHHP